MNWTKDALLSKAKLYFQKAQKEDRDSIYFGTYCAFGLELLARAALASFSPVLLAEPRSTESMLYALSLKDVGGKQRSITTNSVISLCGEIIPDFNKDMQHIASIMAERRNEELHSGGGGFAEYNMDKWISGFYQACQVLGKTVNETLESLFGSEAAKEAFEIIQQDTDKIKKTVLEKINACKKAFEEDLIAKPEEISALIDASKKKYIRKDLPWISQGYMPVL